MAIYKSLANFLDKRLVLILRDGRNLIGVLRSYDQYSNLVFQDTVERIYAKNMYADIPRGIFLIRGENVVMMAELGTIEECIEAERKRGLLGPVDVQQVLMLQKEELDRKERMQKAKKMIILEKGSDFEMDSVQFQ